MTKNNKYKLDDFVFNLIIMLSCSVIIYLIFIAFFRDHKPKEFNYQINTSLFELKSDVIYPNKEDYLKAIALALSNKPGVVEFDKNIVNHTTDYNRTVNPLYLISYLSQDNKNKLLLEIEEIIKDNDIKSSEFDQFINNLEKVYFNNELKVIENIKNSRSRLKKEILTNIYNLSTKEISDEN